MRAYDLIMGAVVAPICLAIGSVAILICVVVWRGFIRWLGGYR